MEDASLDLVGRSLGLPAHPRVFLWPVAPLLPCRAETSRSSVTGLGCLTIIMLVGDGAVNKSKLSQNDNFNDNTE